MGGSRGPRNSPTRSQGAQKGSCCLSPLEVSAWLLPTETKEPGSLKLPSRQGEALVLARGVLRGKKGCLGL